MRFHRSFHIRPVSIVLVLVLSILGFVPLAHASSYVGYGSVDQGGNPASGPINNWGAGEIVTAPLTGQLTSVGIFVGTSLPSFVVILTSITVPSSGTYSCPPAGTCAFANTGFSFTVQDSESLSGLSTGAFFTITLASPVSVSTGNAVAIMFTGCAVSQTCIYEVGHNGQTTVLDSCFNFGTNNPTVGGSFTTQNTGSGNCEGFAAVVGGTFTSSGQTGQTTAVTQCYGNCGNPAVTLANTNSTHTVNFNQSITLFYQFQSNVNGFLLNITTSMAKSYTAIPNAPSFGIYTIPSCPSGASPFSPQCPGLLQQSAFQIGGTGGNGPPKGKISFSGLRVPVFNGQWVGIALSAALSGLDVNDTNTNVNLWQTNEGKIPSSIQSPASLGNSKVGLWAWINGNVITGGPPTSPSSGNCGPGLDFILACAVNSLCTVVTTQCQTGSSIFLIVILTIVSIAALLGIFSYWLPGMNLTTKGMGEFAVLIFIGWFVAFAAYGLLLPYMIIFMFFVVAWLFLGRSRGTGPI